MIKIIRPDNFEFNDPIASLVPIHRGGIDSSWMTKHAALDFQRAFETVKPSSNSSLIHLIAMGASDTYPMNRNGDIFYKSARTLDLAEPDWHKIKLADGTTETKSASTFKDHTDVGLLETYKTFEKFAHVFKHHKNRPHNGDKIWGAVKAAGYNDPMDRVELLVEVNNDEWRDDLQKMAEGQQLPWSMACILNPATLVLTEHGYKPIVSILPGEKVLTHRGNWKRVTNIIHRRYSGKVKTLNVNGHPFKLELTVDHPMLASVSKTHLAKMLSSPPGTEKPKQPDTSWIHTDHLNKGDALMYMPPTEFENYEPIVNAHIASALGEVISGTDVSNITQLMLSKYLGDERDFYLGLFSSPVGSRLAFLGALIDGVNGEVSKHGLSWVDADGVLVLYVRDLFMSVGIDCSLKSVAIESTEGEKSTGYMITVDVAQSPELYMYSGKMHNGMYIDRLKEEAMDHQPYSNRYFTSIITDTTLTDVEDVMVYNLEVEDDESYLIAGFVSHNCKVAHDICSVCGHAAPSRNKYCEHLTDNMTDMLKSGHAVGAINDHMTFFDISRVNRPADRIAWSLVKTASDLAAEIDLALDPTYYPYPDVGPQTANIKSAADKYELLRKLAEIEKKIPLSARLANMRNMVRPSAHAKATPAQDKCAAFTALSKRNICLPFDAFATVMFGTSEKLANVVSLAKPYLSTLFSDILGSDRVSTVVSNESYDPSTYLSDKKYEKFASELEKEYGFNYDSVKARTLVNALYKHPTEKQAMVRPELTKTAQELLDQYASYKLSFLLGAKNSQNSETFNSIQELSVIQNSI